MLYDVSHSHPSASDAAFASSPDIAAVAGARRILIVEDDPMNRKLFRDLLQAKGYDVRCAENGAEGLTACRENQPDLVLLDVQLPILGGVEVARAISEATPAPRIIAISAFAGKAEAARLGEAGCADCIQKPAPIADLLLRIELVLAGATQ